MTAIYRSINAVIRELAKTGLAKRHFNDSDGYTYRSIDDVVDLLAPLIAKHGICILPRMLHRSSTERREDEHLLTQVTVRTAFHLVSKKDGSNHIVECFGEALDAGDKATAKAAAAAFKTAMVQAFCIPFAGCEDLDSVGHQARARTHIGEPIGGWQQWCREVEDIVSVCESDQAIKLVQDRNRELLKGLSRERPNLYRQLGEKFTSRRQLLANAERLSDKAPRGRLGPRKINAKAEDATNV